MFGFLSQRIVHMLFLCVFVCFILFMFLIEGKLLYSVVLVFALQ